MEVTGSRTTCNFRKFRAGTGKRNAYLLGADWGRKCLTTSVRIGKWGTQPCLYGCHQDPLEERRRS